MIKCKYVLNRRKKMKTTKILLGLLAMGFSVENSMASDKTISVDIRQGVSEEFKEQLRQSTKAFYLRDIKNINVDEDLLPKVPPKKEMLFILGVSDNLSEEEQKLGFQSFIEQWNLAVNVKELNLGMFQSKINLMNEDRNAWLLLDKASKQYTVKNLNQKINCHYYRSFLDSQDTHFYEGLIIVRDKQIQLQQQSKIQELNFQQPQIQNLNQHKKSAKLK